MYLLYLSVNVVQGGSPHYFFFLLKKNLVCSCILINIGYFILECMHHIIRTHLFELVKHSAMYQKILIFTSFDGYVLLYILRGKYPEFSLSLNIMYTINEQ